MPKDTNAITQPMSSFDSEEEVHSFISEQVGLIASAQPIRNKPLSFFETLAGFFVEFPLYTVFPPVSFLSERLVRRGRYWVVVTTRFKPVPVLQSADPDRMVELAYICVLVVPLKEGTLKNGDIQAVYDFAEVIANEYIQQYKLLPGRHHHDLNLLNNTTSGVMGIVHKLSIKPLVKIESKEVLFLNSGVMNLAKNAAPFTEDEFSLIAASLGGYDSDIWREVQRPLFRLVRAFDENCHGDADSAIALATSSLEGFLMVTQKIIRVHDYGEDKSTVERRISRKHLAELLAYAESDYGLNLDKTSQRTTYGRWHHRCYKKRNDYIHKQHDHTPHDSRPAIVSTAKLIAHISTLIERRHRKYSQIAYFTRLITDSFN